VEAIVDHITQTLPNADGCYCQPLATPYLKALSSVFEHQANVERLKGDVWRDVVDFCVQGIDLYLNENEEPSGPPRSFSGLGTSHLSGSVAKSISSNGNSQNRQGSLSRTNVEDLFQTLHFLISASNAPISDRYAVVLDITVRYLQLSGSNIGQVHQFAFSIVNTVVGFIRVDRISFCHSIAEEVIPVICRFWQGKSLAKDEMLNLVRDEMLIFLFTIHLHLERSIKDNEATELFTKIESLLDILRADYSRRSDRDQLQLDDMEMADLGAIPSGTHPFLLKVFRIRPYNPRAERNWAHLQVVGILERLASLGHGKRKSELDEGDHSNKHPQKRQRLEQDSDRLLEPLRSGDERLRLAALQTLPFVLQNCQLDVPSLTELLAQLHLCVGDKRGNIASWALLAIAR